MSRHPVDIALREISDTQHLLEAVITSSESFDYFQAKSALERLEKKVRTLARLRAELQADQGARPDLGIIPFPGNDGG